MHVILTDIDVKKFSMYFGLDMHTLVTLLKLFRQNLTLKSRLGEINFFIDCMASREMCEINRNICKPLRLKFFI
jgi:hypothetical protein